MHFICSIFWTILQYISWINILKPAQISDIQLYYIVYMNVDIPISVIFLVLYRGETKENAVFKYFS